MSLDGYIIGVALPPSHPRMSVATYLMIVNTVRRVSLSIGLQILGVKQLV